MNYESKNTLHIESYCVNLLGMIKRSIDEIVKNALDKVPAVALLGARQIGKTTLAKKIAKDDSALYLDLESPEDQLKLTDPVSFLQSHQDKLIILDEIQRAPELFTVLRGLIDKGREKNRRTGQFLLLGSASMDLMRQSSESLAGRIRYIKMSGLNALEVDQDVRTRNKLWLRGGFPDSFLALHDDDAMDWLYDITRTYLERDIPQMGFQIPAKRLLQLWTMLAHLQGETLNYSKLGANLEVSHTTVRHYVDILEDLFLVRRLQPWYKNVKKRLVKSPRLYISDSGIQHGLLGINNYDQLLSNPILGKSWEGFVIENIQSILPRRSETFFYRTASGAEIDLVIKMPSSEIWAIEIKYGSSPRLNKNFHITCDDIQAERKYIVYGGDDSFSVGNDVTVMSLQKIMRLIVDENIVI